MSSEARQILPYGSWPSTISARSLIAGVVGFSELTSEDDTLYWLESRPEEAGRTVLVRWRDGAATDLTPAPFNVRSRVHEYGGGAFTVAGGSVWFVNFADQNLHAIRPDGSVDQLTRSDPGTRFADFVVDREHQRLITVVEQHREGSEPENFLGAVDLTTGEVTVLARGHDFYAAPRLSPDGSRLAFIAWDHPGMPWDGTVLQTARFADDGGLVDRTTVAGGIEESVLQPCWQDDGALLFMSDSSGYWNLYRFDESGTYCLFEDEHDQAGPPWVFRMQSYALAGSEHALVLRHGDDGDEIFTVNTETTMGSPFLTGPSRSYSSLTVQGADLCVIAADATAAPTIERLPLAGGGPLVLRAAGGPSIAPDDISVGEAITFPTRDGRHAHAYFYPPTSATCRGPDDERPPLLVISHGGPTAAATGTLNLRIQYYTSRGWAVLDVNYRGSSGFGRAYRTALNGRWGVLDVTDCEDGVRHLARTDRIDPDRIAIRGGSAGGYTTLAALTLTNTFRAGASHYGIGDLHALARDTHKFESRYLDSLLDGESALEERSPINHLDRFTCPVIFFQGSEDKVVPPNQSRLMADAVRAKGIPVAYMEFEGEGHGFRDSENIVRSVESEYGFFCRVFHITPADDLPDIPIDNAEHL